MPNSGNSFQLVQKCIFPSTLYQLALPVPQNLATLPPPPEPADWSAVSINTDLYLGTIRASVSNLIDKFQEELKRLYGKGEETQPNQSINQSTKKSF